MFLSTDQLIALLTTLLFLELFLGVLLVWAIFKLKRMQHNLGNLGRDKYKELLEWQQETRFALMENYKSELSALTEKAADSFSSQLEESLQELQSTTNTGIQEIEKLIQKHAQSISTSLNETNKDLTAQLTAELNEFKQQKTKALEKQASDIAQKAASELIGNQIDTTEQHAIVKRLLNEAWEEGAITNE